jgi:hypothetical protein
MKGKQQQLPWEGVGHKEETTSFTFWWEEALVGKCQWNNKRWKQAAMAGSMLGIGANNLKLQNYVLSGGWPTFWGMTL